ncbi:MAG: alkaline phosphatase family protein, partial [Myxococcota bacterium]
MFVFTLACSRGPDPADLPPLPPQKVVLVGVDGASWTVMGPMIERGELPTFARLIREGASRTAFDTLEDTSSPVIWTSVATGAEPKVHGVEAYTQDLPGGGKVPITSNARKVNALWNVASDHGRTVSVINWWASWPAEPVNGTIVSDHANPAAAQWMADKYWTADRASLQNLHKDTHPPELADALGKYWLDPFPMDDLADRAGLTPAQREVARAAPFNERSSWSWFKTFYALDRPHLSIALDQLRTAPPDLTMVYLRGPDPVQHYAWDTVQPEAYAKPPPELERDRGIVQGVYRYVDQMLAEVLAALPPDTTLIVASDHGAEPCAHIKRTKRPGCHTVTAKGVLFLYGPSVVPGAELGRTGPLDLAPTLAWVLDLPLAEDFAGEPLTAAFTPEFVARRTGRTVPTWGT